ncbi:nucleic acid-binding protein [Streptomyces mirabilis]|nr:nucleic acid-binding protein [Streptomyces mirabilis]
MSHHSHQNPREPDDLLEAQRELNAVRAELDALIKKLPYSVEPAEAWERPEGYWLASARTFPASPGWTDPEREQVADLRARERALAEFIVFSPFWFEVAPAELADARSRLKHARKEAEQEA